MDVQMRRALPIAFTLLAGCATYQAQPIAPAQLALQFQERSLVSEDLRAYLSRELGQDVQPWPPARWNREMLSLAAWYYSPALDIARPVGYSQSRYRGCRQDSEPGPSISFSVLDAQPRSRRAVHDRPSARYPDRDRTQAGLSRRPGVAPVGSRAPEHRE